MKSQLSKAFEPALTSVEVLWQQFDDDAAKPIQVILVCVCVFSITTCMLPCMTNLLTVTLIVTYIQAPQEIVSLFSGSRQVIYGFVPHCLQVHVYICKYIVTANLLDFYKLRILYDIRMLAVILT